MAREVGRLRKWRDKVWSRRYEAIVIKAAREVLRTAYGLFLSSFREAAERLKAGDRTARFPNGCFPPGLPFVRA